MLTSSIFGMLLGCLYFGGLWWSLIHLGERRSAPLFLVGSFALRSITLLGAFYLIARGDPMRLVTTLLGFVAMRIVLICVLRARTGPV